MLTTTDFAVIAVYLVGVIGFGIWAGGRQRNVTDYFLGDRDLPWWAVCFSVVATETSTLTIIGIPAVAYLGSLTFLQLTLGYVLGRIIVSVLLLPRYARGELATAYAFLGKRFGAGLQATASVVFLVTRLLADGVRLFATAIPLKVMLDLMGFDVSYFAIIAMLGIATILYTLIGGIRAVVWMDVVQMSIYVGGAILAIVWLLGGVPAGWWTAAQEAGKTSILNFQFLEGVISWLTAPYAFVTAVVGGAVFSMASHGTDQLIVQRLLACRTLEDSQKALIGSGVLVFGQFALFLLVGLLLWSFYGGATIDDLGLTRGDEIFPLFIVQELPPGVSGLILAGIIAAAMSTLSSSLNALASSTMLDLYRYLSRTPLSEARELFTSRAFTLLWGLVFIGFAGLFQDQQNPVVELGLEIASFTYGGLLGVFLLGLWSSRTRQTDAIVAFLIGIGTMVAIIFGAWFSTELSQWVFLFRPGAEAVEALGLRSIGWPWYTVIGASVTVGVGSLLGLRHKRPVRVTP